MTGAHLGARSPTSARLFANCARRTLPQAASELLARWSGRCQETRRAAFSAARRLKLPQAATGSSPCTATKFTGKFARLSAFDGLVSANADARYSSRFLTLAP